MAKPRNGQHVPLADQLRLGPEVAAVKARTSPKQWKQLVKAAHAKGVTVAGQLSGVPDPLKERSKSSLMKEAQRVVAASFAPANKELGQQEQRIRALDAKRQTDNAHFQSWLANEQSKLGAQSQAADAELTRRQGDIQAQTQARFQSAQASAQQTAAAAPGNVSDPSQSKALDFSAAANQANSLIANQRTASSQMMGNAQARNAGYAQVSYALGREAENKRQSDATDAMTKVSEGRTNLALKAADEVAQAVQRLYGVEVDKADANRNYLAAADKLGVDAQKLDLTAAKNKADTKIKTKKLDLDSKKVDQQRAIEDAKLALGYDRIKSAEGQKAADRQLKLYIAENPKKGSSKPSSGQTTASAKVYNRLSSVAGEIKRLRGNTKRPLRAVLGEKGVSSIEYEIALDIATYGKLSATNQKRAKALGLIVPKEWRP